LSIEFGHAVATMVVIVGLILRQATAQKVVADMNDQPSTPSAVLSDGLGDWRFRFVQNVMRSGRLVRISAPGELQAPNGDRFEFTDFMPPALFLNVAIAADARANALRDRLTPEEFIARAGLYKAIPSDKIGPLFDCIEQSSVAAVLSSQALEAYRLRHPIPSWRWSACVQATSSAQTERASRGHRAIR
jgi:hypothetical protein